MLERIQFSDDGKKITLLKEDLMNLIDLFETVTAILDKSLDCCEVMNHNRRGLTLDELIKEVNETKMRGLTDLGPFLTEFIEKAQKYENDSNSNSND